MKLSLLLVLSLALLLVAVEGKRGHKGGKGRNQDKLPESLSCRLKCASTCSTFRTCKKDVCRPKCKSAEVGNRKSCKKTCKREDCDKSPCITCVRACRTVLNTCKTSNCATECPDTLGKKYLKNSDCRSCMDENCSTDPDA